MGTDPHLVVLQLDEAHLDLTARQFREDSAAGTVTTARIPQTLESLTADWFNAVLAASDLLEAGSVAGVSWTRIGEGFGFTGIVVRADLALTGGGASVPVIVKLPFAEAEGMSGYQAAHQGDEAYVERCVRETRFYCEIAGDPAPRAYYAAGDTAQRRALLVLEDLSDGRAGDVLAGCSPADATVVLDAIARFHARNWTAAAPDWLPHWGGSKENAARQERFARQAPAFLEGYGRAAPDSVRVRVAELQRRLGDVRSSLASGPRTLIHADLHLDNVIFDPSDGRACVVLDWQSVCVGPPALDVAAFLVGSLSVENRRENEPALLARYAETLEAAGVCGYGLPKLLRDYRLALSVMLAGVVGWTERGSLTGRERALQDAALGDGRLVAALVDHGVGAR